MAKQKDDKRTPELPHLDLNVTAFLVAVATLPQHLKQTQFKFSRQPGASIPSRPGSGD